MWMITGLTVGIYGSDLSEFHIECIHADWVCTRSFLEPIIGQFSVDIGVFRSHWYPFSVSLHFIRECHPGQDAGFGIPVAPMRFSMTGDSQSSASAKTMDFATLHARWMSAIRT